jgi:methylthioribose-1-phosphate isomerase
VVAAPSSTFDLTLTDGSSIPIEQRDPAELIWMGEKRIVPEGVAVENPAFDVTPAELIDAIVTERGVIEPVKAATVQALIA